MPLPSTKPIGSATLSTKGHLSAEHWLRGTLMHWLRGWLHGWLCGTLIPRSGCYIWKSRP